MKHPFRAAISLLLSLTLAAAPAGLSQPLPVFAAEVTNWYQTWTDIGRDDQFRYAATDNLELYANGFGATLREYCGDEQIIRVPDVFQDESKPVIGIEYDGTTIRPGEGIRQHSLTAPASVRWITLYDFSASDTPWYHDPIDYYDFITTITVFNPECDIRIPQIEEILRLLRQDGLELTIRGIPGSSAERFAAQYGLPFENAIGKTGRLSYAFDADGVIITGCDPVEWDWSRGNPVYESLRIPDEISGMPVTAIASYAFSVSSFGPPYHNETAQLYIPDSVRTIFPYAFAGCNDFTEIRLPDGLEVIPNGAFCDSVVRSVRFPSALKEIGEEAFFNSALRGSLVLPRGLRSIGYNAFASSAVEAADLPDSLETLGYAAFADCGELLFLRIPPKITSLPTTLCTGCSLLREIILPETLTVIESYALSYTGLQTVRIPASCTEIADQAFASSELREIYLPDSVTQLGSGVFMNCYELRRLGLSAGLTEIRSSLCYGCLELESVNIPSGVTRIGSNAFSNCYGITELTLPDCLEEIGGSAFRWSGLTELTIPESVTWIGEDAFLDSMDLQMLTFLNKEFSISGDMLSERMEPTICSYVGSTAQEYAASHNLEFIDIESGETVQPVVRLYFETAEDHAVVTGVNIRRVRNLDIPSEYEGLPVTEIASDAFCYCVELQSVSLPDTLQRIGRNVFVELSTDGLTIPASVTEFESYAIRNIMAPHFTFTVLNPECAMNECLGERKDCVTDNLTICGYRNSTAHAYANWLGAEFRTLDGELVTEPTNRAYEPSEGYIISHGNDTDYTDYTCTTDCSIGGGWGETCTTCWDPGTQPPESTTTSGSNTTTTTTTATTSGTIFTTATSYTMSSSSVITTEMTGDFSTTSSVYTTEMTCDSGTNWVWSETTTCFGETSTCFGESGTIISDHGTNTDEPGTMTSDGPYYTDYTDYTESPHVTEYGTECYTETTTQPDYTDYTDYTESPHYTEYGTECYTETTTQPDYTDYTDYTESPYNTGCETQTTAAETNTQPYETDDTDYTEYTEMQSVPPDVPLTGDVDSSGAVTIGDAVLLARIIAEDKDLKPADCCFENGDLNGDGCLLLNDLNALLRLLADTGS